MMSTRWRKRPWAAAAVLCVVFVGSSSSALLSPGARLSAARVVDADDRMLDLRSIVGRRPLLVFYEDKESRTLNAALKNELSELMKYDHYRSAVVIVPVADVRRYDYWPVRGFVKSAIRSESRKLGTTIYCDWDGSFGRALDVQRGTSTVVLIGKSTRVLFAYEGTVPGSDTRRLLDLLRSEVERGSD